MLLGASADAADSITDRLVDENFINEQRYTQAFVHDKFSLNRWGKNKIAATLSDCISDDETAFKSTPP